jgi:hypothetical protein
MINATLDDLILAGVCGIIFSLVLDEIRGWIKKPRLQNRHRIVLFLIAVAVAFPLLYLFANPKPANPNSPRPEVYLAPTCEETSSILKNGYTQYDEKCSGFVTRWSGSVYLVVRPVNSNPPLWLIQQPLVLAAPDENGKRNWVGHAWFATYAGDEGEDFSIYAIAATSKYQAKQTLISEPDGYASEIITLTRPR